MADTKKSLERVYPWIQNVYCKCGGKLEASGGTLLTDPPQHPHTCKDCGKVYNLRDADVPQVIFKTGDGDIVG